MVPNAVILELARALVKACRARNKDDEVLKAIDGILRRHREGKLELWRAADEIVDHLWGTRYEDWLQKSLGIIMNQSKAFSLPGLASVFDDDGLVRLVCPCEGCGFDLELEGALLASLTCPCHGKRLVTEGEKKKGAKACEGTGLEGR